MKLFVDMDGTLAEWKSESKPEELLQAGYFEKLQPLNSVKTIALLAIEFKDIYILSAVIPDSATAKTEKREWIKKYLPEIPETHILFSRNGDSKREFVKKTFGKVTRSDFLLDDYSKNLDDWSLEGTGVKFLNGINAKSGRTYENVIREGNHAFDVVQNALYLRNLMQKAM